MALGAAGELEEVIRAGERKGILDHSGESVHASLSKPPEQIDNPRDPLWITPLVRADTVDLLLTFTIEGTEDLRRPRTLASTKVRRGEITMSM